MAFELKIYEATSRNNEKTKTNRWSQAEFMLNTKWSQAGLGILNKGITK